MPSLTVALATAEPTREAHRLALLTRTRQSGQHQESRVAAAARVGIISAAGASGVASAGTLETTVRTPSLELSARTAQQSTTGTRLPVAEGYTIAGVTAHSTGDGPADDKECQAWADLMNSLIGMAHHELDEGRTEGAASFAAEADKAESDALGRGCFVLH